MRIQKTPSDLQDKNKTVASCDKQPQKKEISRTIPKLYKNIFDKMTWYKG